MPFFWIPTIIVAFFVIVSLTIAYIFSGVTLYSVRQPIITTPRDYGLNYEDVKFRSTDGLTLKGWFIPARPTNDDGPDKVIILTHPMTFNRHGFVVKNQGWLPLFKTDVDLLQIAPALHQEGYALLMFDFRNHGESDGGITGAGLNEYQDVLGAIEYVKSRPSLCDPQIGFFSFCMGANSTIIALSKGGDLVKDIKFLVAIQPVSSYAFFPCYMKDLYTPLSLYLIPIVDRIVQWRGGYAFAEMSPLAYAKDVQAPTLYVQAREDRWTKPEDVQGFYDATPGPKELWWIEGPMRRFETYNLVCKDPSRLVAFARQRFSGN